LQQRWPNGVECPRCGSKDVLFLAGYQRWHCRAKHKAPQFTLKTGTIMENSPIALKTWLRAFRFVGVEGDARRGGRYLSSMIGVTPKTGCSIMRRIVAARDPGAPKSIRDPLLALIEAVCALENNEE
jgi:hypothetical protein